MQGTQVQGRESSAVACSFVDFVSPRHHGFVLGSLRGGRGEGISPGLQASTSALQPWLQQSSDTRGPGAQSRPVVGNGHSGLQMRPSEKRRAGPGRCWWRQEVLCPLRRLCQGPVPSMASTGMTASWESVSLSCSERPLTPCLPTLPSQAPRPVHLFTAPPQSPSYPQPLCIYMLTSLKTFFRRY